MWIGLIPTEYSRLSKVAAVAIVVHKQNLIVIP